MPTDKYIFCYFLGPRKDIRDEALSFAKSHGYKVLYFPHMEEFRDVDVNSGDFEIWDANARDFIKLMDNAAFVFTDSFHGTVFSILLHKKFRTYYREFGQSTNSRIDSLMSIFGLKNRLASVSSVESINDDVDYQHVDDKLVEYRKESMQFLEDALSLSSRKRD